jgi:hypothetical protein
MREVIAYFVAKCGVCHCINAKHYRPTITLWPLSTLERKWDKLGMDFNTDCPKIQRDNNAIWLIADILSWLLHLLHVREQMQARHLDYLSHVFMAIRRRIPCNRV